MTPATLRIGIVAAFGTVLALLTGGIFDGVRWPVLIAPPVVAAVALAAGSWPARWRVASEAAAVALAVAAVVLIAGGAPGDIRRSLTGGMRLALTTEWPSPAVPEVVGAVTLLVAVVTAAAADLAGRGRFHLAPLAPLVAGLAAIVALGAPAPPPTWTLVAIGALALLFGLTRPDEPAGRRARTLAGEPSLAASVVVVAAVVLVTSGAIAWADRADPRRTQAAAVTAALLDPIEAIVALREADPPIDLFLLTDRSRLIGRSLPTRWRLAALDSYDGQRWVPSITLRPIGERLGLPPPPAPDRAPPVELTIEVLTDDIDLVPLPGRPLVVRAEVETDVSRAVVRLARRPAPGTTVDVIAEVAPSAGSIASGVVAARQVDEIAATFTELATNLAGEGTVLDRLRAIEETMRTEWQLDPATAGGGLQLALLDRFLTETRRGTAEQFATAFVLLARSLGVNARIATGFVVPPDAPASPAVLRSPQAAAWPEIEIDEVGWLAFDPVPPGPTTDAEQPPPPPEAQSPAAAQPPIAPAAERAERADELRTDAASGDGRWAAVRTWAGRIAVVAGVGVLPVLLAAGVIVVLKARRRRRRLRARDPADRVRGAWANVTDSFVDAGLTIAPAWTDARIAEVAVPLAPTVPHELRRLARMSTATTFGAPGDASRLVDDAVTTSTAIERAIRAQRSGWRRIRLHLSLRSLRPATRSPVTAR